MIDEITTYLCCALSIACLLLSGWVGEGSATFFIMNAYTVIPGLTGEPGTLCNPKPRCGGDGPKRATGLLQSLEALMKFRPFGSEAI